MFGNFPDSAEMMHSNRITLYDFDASLKYIEQNIVD